MSKANFSVVLPDQIIDGFSLDEAEDIAEFHIELIAEGFMRRASWLRDDFRIEYLIFENGVRIVALSIEKHKEYIL